MQGRLPNDLVYLDNAATTFPKPKEVLSTLLEGYRLLGVSPGRGSYDLSTRAASAVDRVRERICRFFDGDNPDRVIFSANATDALNTLILGLAEPGCHVISTRLEHNSVLRPLHHLAKQGVIRLTLVPFDPEGFVDPGDVERAMEKRTRFVIMTHGSNTLGTIQPVASIARACRDRGVPLLLDVSQTAGIIPVQMRAWGVDAVAFTGHKSLLGPTGIGGLVLSRDLEVRPTRFGGTGFDSISLDQPDSYPYRLEAGTLNLMGILGLEAGLFYIEKEGMDRLRAHETMLASRLLEGLSRFDEIVVYGGGVDPEQRLPIVLCNVEGYDPADVGDILDGDFGIAVRTGLHCAPLVHQHIGTAGTGAVRFSIGPFNQTAHIEKAVEAMGQIAMGAGK